MRRNTWMHGTMAVALFGAGLFTGWAAGAVGNAPQRTEQARTDLSVTPEMEVIGSLIEIPPGGSGKLHIHHGVELYHVLQGAPIEVPGLGATELVTGATAFNLRDVPHGAFTVRGDTPLRLLTVHIVDKGKPLYDEVP